MRLIFLTLGLIVVSFCYSQPVKYSNEFMSIGTGARQLAMGSVSSSTVKDIYSVYWNPAGLSESLNDIELGAMHSEYFAGIANYDFLAVAKRLADSSYISLSMFRFGVDDIPNTLELVDKQGNIWYDRIKSFSVADYAFLVSFSNPVSPKGINYGGSLKVIRRVIGDFASAWGIGLDFGLTYRFGDWRLGIMGRDISSTYNLWKFNNEEFEYAFTLTGNEIPINTSEVTLPKFIPSLSRSFTFKENFTLIAEAGANITSDGKRNVLLKGDPFSIDPATGVEFSYKKMFFIRGGINNMQTVPDFDNKKIFDFQPNFGVGVNIKKLNIDYAFTDIGGKSIALYSHVFSISFGINKNETEQTK